ncbi:NADAR family protein [Legionella nagasakiensis]|uniref:NADAR family protein n=1 Tax=Legionella nagasakiensis TaxID=535290 RepID=UPI0010552297|nr:NADAR family protein [Legionella nagasakiensis]
MPMPFLQCGAFKIAPFKQSDVPPYGAFANTTKAGIYPIPQTVSIGGQSHSFTWPSSEHAFHAQKLLFASSQLPPNDPRQQHILAALKKLETTKAGAGEELDPRKDFAPIAADLKAKKGVDIYDLMNNPPSFTRETVLNSCMENVLREKFARYPKLREAAMNCAREGIIPIESSRYDSNWASGNDGNGANKLGIAILRLGNQYLREAGQAHEIKIPDPAAEYARLKSQHGSAALTHDNLVGDHNQFSNPSTWAARADISPAATPMRPMPSTTMRSAPRPAATTMSAPSPLNIWFDKDRGHTVVETQRGANLQLHIKQDGTRSVIFRTGPGQVWQKGSLQHPAAAALLRQYQAQMQARPTVAPSRASPTTMPASTPLNIWDDTRRNHTVVETHRGANLQLHVKRDGTMKVMFRTGPGQAWQDGNIRHPAAAALLQRYQAAGMPKASNPLPSAAPTARASATHVLPQSASTVSSAAVAASHRFHRMAHQHPGATPPSQPWRLTPEQTKKIGDLIRTLKGEIDSSFPYPNKDRKQEKVNALEQLLKISSDGSATSAAKAVEDVLKTHPKAADGVFSTRTSALLTEIANSAPATKRDQDTDHAQARL